MGLDGHKSGAETSLILIQTFSIVLTRNRATAVPRMNPATTSEQWFRYSETRLSPVRKAEQSVPRQSTGLARRLDLVLMVLVMYIWKREGDLVLFSLILVSSS